MRFRKRVRPWRLSRFCAIAAIAMTPAVALAGLWIYLANINPDIKVPMPVMPAPNAYDDCVAATKLLVRRDDIGDALLPSGAPGRKVFTTEEKEDLVRANQPALARLRQGFAHEYLEPPVRSFTAVMPHLTKYRDLARLLSLEGQVKAAHGDYAGAMDSCLDSVQFGQESIHGGTIIGRLVGIAIQAIGRKPAWSAVAHLDGPASRKAARRMEAINAREFPYADTIREEMWAGQAGMMEMFRKNEQWKIGSYLGDEEETDQRTSDLAFGIWFQLYGKRRTLANYTGFMEASAAQARQPYSVSTPDVPIPADPMNRVIAPLFSRARFTDVAKLQAPNALLTVSLALQAYRAEHGAHPASLAQLAPDYLKRIPGDPFAAGAPLRYRRTATGFCLYSVGPDGKDDGGKAIDDPSKGTEPHRRYRVERDSKGDMVAGINIYG